MLKKKNKVNHKFILNRGHYLWAASRKVVIRDLIKWIQALQRLPLPLINNLRGRFQIKFGMTSLCNKGAFTLIELLVVVLIIGILAAVAVPQYKVAVLKTKFAKLYSISRTYQRAAQEHIMSTGDWPDRFESLSLDAPAGFTPKTPTSSDCVEDDEFYCCIKQYKSKYQWAGITCGLADYSLGYDYDKNINSGEQNYCFAKQTDTAANRICAMYNQTKISANLITPTGHIVGYYRYSMPKN